MEDYEYPLCLIGMDLTAEPTEDKVGLLPYQIYAKMFSELDIIYGSEDYVLMKPYYLYQLKDSDLDIDESVLDSSIIYTG